MMRIDVTDYLSILDVLLVIWELFVITAIVVNNKKPTPIESAISNTKRIKSMVFNIKQFKVVFTAICLITAALALLSEGSEALTNGIACGIVSFISIMLFGVLHTGFKVTGIENCQPFIQYFMAGKRELHLHLDEKKLPKFLGHKQKREFLLQVAEHLHTVSKQYNVSLVMETPINISGLIRNLQSMGMSLIEQQDLRTPITRNLILAFRKNRADQKGLWQGLWKNRKQTKIKLINGLGVKQ